MSDPIVRSSEPITLVGGGAVADGEIHHALTVAPGLVAADGGAAHCLRAGHVPQAVIGDMDSFETDARLTVPEDRLFPITEQDSTDFDKALRHIQASVVLGLGFSGGRADHQLACFNTLVRYPDRRCVLVNPTDLVFLAPPVLRLRLDPGSRVSLFPMGLVEGQSSGLQWPIGGLSFAPDGRVGTSNKVALDEGGEVELILTAPKMLIILPASARVSVMAALRQASATWPAL